ncbi:MAG: ribosome maturation factor RimP [Alphaproteobacteria bacterium]
METTDAASRVERIIAPTLDDMGYEVVRVQLSGGRQHSRLQVMAERADQQGMTVDDCAEISRAVSALLDVEDPIAGSYDLEVSSPGIDRPLTRAHDFERFAGHQAKIEMRQTIEGRRRFRGLLKGLEDGHAVLEMEGETLKLPVGEVERAKLVMPEEMAGPGHGRVKPDRRRGR